MIAGIVVEFAGLLDELVHGFSVGKLNATEVVFSVKVSEPRECELI